MKLCKFPVKYVKILVLVLLTSLYREIMWTWEPNLVRYTGGFFITGFVISAFLPIQITVILPSPIEIYVNTGTSLYRGSFSIEVPLYRERLN